jgi:MFS family permease
MPYDIYEIGRLSANISYQHWISKELFSFGWLVTAGALIVTYGMWFKLVDKRRIKDLLLLGSLCSVAFAVIDTVLVGFLGLWSFKIRLFPFDPPLFIVGLTMGPIMYMLVFQYTSSWRSFFLWNAIGCAVIVFGILPLYSLLGIFQLYKWNWFFHFLLFFSVGTVARGLLYWFTSIEQSQLTSNRVTRVFPLTQPLAIKPLIGNNNDKTDNDQ